MLNASRISGPTEIENRRLRRLYEYWNEKRGSRRAPARGEINPTEIPDLLGYVNMFDVVDGARDYRVRLNGSEVTRMLGREITGMLCSEVTPGEDGERYKQAFEICVNEWSPAIVETTLAFCGKPHAGQTLVALPLSSDGRHVDTMITAHAYHTVEIPLDQFPYRRVSEG